MTSIDGSVLVFYALALLTVSGAAVVAAGQNIVRSAFALLATFLGMAGLYATLGADLVAVVQLLVYVGGVLILILFAVMLTARISDANVSNRAVGVGTGFAALLLLSGPLIYFVLSFPWPGKQLAAPAPTTHAIGDALLGPYVLPFEVISVLLLAVLVGGVTLARPRSAGRPRPQTPSKESTS